MFIYGLRLDPELKFGDWTDTKDWNIGYQRRARHKAWAQHIKGEILPLLFFPEAINGISLYELFHVVDDAHLKVDSHLMKTTAPEALYRDCAANQPSFEHDQCCALRTKGERGVAQEEIGCSKEVAARGWCKVQQGTIQRTTNFRCDKYESSTLLVLFVPGTLHSPHSFVQSRFSLEYQNRPSMPA